MEEQDNVFCECVVDGEVGAWLRCSCVQCVWLGWFVGGWKCPESIWMAIAHQHRFVVVFDNHFVGIKSGSAAYVAQLPDRKKGV